MRMVGAEYGTDLRGPTRCEVIDEAQVADVVAGLGPDLRCADADRPGPGGESPSPQGNRCATDGPVGARRGR